MGIALVQAMRQIVLGCQALVESDEGVLALDVFIKALQECNGALRADQRKACQYYVCKLQEVRAARELSDPERFRRLPFVDQLHDMLSSCLRYYLRQIFNGDEESPFAVLEDSARYEFNYETSLHSCTRHSRNFIIRERTFSRP